MFKIKKTTLPLVMISLLCVWLALDNAQASSTNLIVQNNSIEVQVTDGDTIKIGNKRIRLWGIDAPELNQICKKGAQEIKCGEVAQVVLMGILKSGDLVCQKLSVDRYMRDVSRCKAGDKDIGGWMVLMGWALDYPKYSHGYYSDYQNESKSGHHGMWALSFDSPQNWRKGIRRYDEIHNIIKWC